MIIIAVTPVIFIFDFMGAINPLFEMRFLCLTGQIKLNIIHLKIFREKKEGIIVGINIFGF